MSEISSSRDFSALLLLCPSAPPLPTPVQIPSAVGPAPSLSSAPESPAPSSGRGPRGVQPRSFCYVDGTGAIWSEGESTGWGVKWRSPGRGPCARVVSHISGSKNLSRTAEGHVAASHLGGCGKRPGAQLRSRCTMYKALRSAGRRGRWGLALEPRGNKGVPGPPWPREWMLLSRAPGGPVGTSALCPHILLKPLSCLSHQTAFRVTPETGPHPLTSTNGTLTPVLSPAPATSLLESPHQMPKFQHIPDGMLWCYFLKMPCFTEFQAEGTLWTWNRLKQRFMG